MALSEAKRASNSKWDAKNMAYQTVKVSKPLLERFRAACSVRGDRVNTVLREAMEHYVSETPNETTIAALQEGDEMLRTDKGPWFYGSTDDVFAALDAEGEDEMC